MSEVELVIGFLIGLVVGAYGCWLGRAYIETGIALMKIEKTKQKEESKEEAKHEDSVVRQSQQSAEPKPGEPVA